MAAAKSYAIPVCSSCRSRMQKNDAGEWTCLSCADAWLREYVESKTRKKSIGGVLLPTGTRDERRVTPSFSDLIPNRRARRAAAKR